MAASEGHIGHGATITGATSGAAGQVRSISIGGVTVAPVAIGNNDSTQGYDEYIPGIADPGTITLDLIYEESQGTIWAGLLETKAARVAEAWTLLVSGSTWLVTGFVSDLGFEVPHDGALTNTVTIQCTGVPAYTAG